MNVDLAKEQAAKPDEDDVDMRKKLWLQIGKFICFILTKRRKNHLFVADK